MADVFTNDLRIREQESGSNAGTWGGLLNTTIRNIASAFGQGSETIPNASTHTITLADGVADEARSLYLKCTGGGQACTVTLAPNTVSKVWIISNETSFTLTFSAGSGANVAVSAGAVKVIVTDGAGSGAAVTDALSGLEGSFSGIDVTGTVTAGKVAITEGELEGNSGNLQLQSGSTGIIYDAANGFHTFRRNGTNALQINGSTGDISFYEDTGTTPKLFWDASAESLGIGVTPSFKFHVKDTFSALAFEHSGGNAVLKIDGGNGDLSGSDFSSITDIGGTLLFGTNGGFEVMRLDSAGQVRLSNTTPVWDTTFSSLVTKGGFTGSQSTSYLYSGQNIYYDGGFKYSASSLATLYEQSFGNHIFYNAPSGTAGNAVSLTPAMTLSASGNLLVGKTVTSLLTAGIALNSNGAIYATADAERPLILNRETSDGSIAEFRKDNTAVGSIASEGGDLVVGTGNVGMRFFDAFNAIIPRISGGGGNDASIDIGLVSGGNNFRFKDLYLSGNAFVDGNVQVAAGNGILLGGAATANKLDDYEQGSWTPTTSGISGVTVKTATYTKVGQLVVVDIRIAWTSSSNDGVIFSISLPFMSNGSGNSTSRTGAVFYQGSSLLGGNAISAHVSAGSSIVSFYNAGGGTFRVILANDVNGAYDWLTTVSYFTDL